MRLSVLAAALLVWQAASAMGAAEVAQPRAVAEQDAEQKSLDRVAALRDDGRLTEARSLAERELANAETAYGRNDGHVAKWLRELGRTIAAQGLYADAEPILKRALAINEKVHGANAKETGESLGDLGTLCADDDRLADAEPLLKRALEIAERALGPDHPETANSLGNLGNLYMAQGRLAEAEPLYLRALAVDEKAWGPDDRHTAASLNNLAELYREQGRFAEAEPLYKRALAIDESKRGLDHPDVASDLGNLALLYQSEERFTEAEQSYRRALDIREKKLGDHPDTATVLSNLANLFIDEGRVAEAEPLLKRAIAISEKSLGFDHPDTATSVNNLAALYSIEGRGADALPLFARTLASLEKSLGPDHPLTAMAANNLGKAHGDDGGLREAEQLIKRAISINDRKLAADHPNQLMALSNLGDVFLNGKRAAEALPLFERWLAGVERNLPADHPEIAMASYELSRCLFELGRIAEAHAAAQRAARITAGRNAQSVARQLKGGWREGFVYDRVFAQDVRAAYALSRANPQAEAALRAEAFEAAQRVGFDDTGRALANMASRFAAGTNALARLLREQQDLLRRLPVLDRRLANALGSNDPATRAQSPALRKESQAIGARLSDIDATLRRDHKAYGDLADPNPIGIAETQSLLKADEAVVLYLPVEEAMFLIAVSKNDVVWAVTPVRSEELTKNIATLRRQLDPDQWQTRPLEPFDRALAHRLYLSMWAPLESVLKDKTQVFIVPAGPLTSFPLAILVSEEPKGGAAGDANPQALRDTAWLIKRHALATLPSISSLKALRVYASKGSGTEPFAGFGDPAFGAPAKMPVASRNVASVFRGRGPDLAALRKFAPLPQTAGELKALAKALGATDAAVYLRERATEGQIKSVDLSKKRVIAFATHGLMAGDMGLGEPGLIFTPPATASERDDGYLSASEAAGLNLKADWIILSACNTAAGDGPGAKGLSGLARAFFLAGSKSLLVSHWPVWDAAAMKLTTGAVINMQKKPADGRAEALRQAMLAVMNDQSAPYFAHPAAWAPFVLVGETRAD